MTFLECWRIAHGVSNPGQDYKDGMRELLKYGSPLRINDPVGSALRIPLPYDSGLEEFDYQRYF
jgi:hypothetical protein